METEEIKQEEIPQEPQQEEVPDKRKGKKPPSKRYRHWRGLVFPDTAPEDWIERLQLTGLPLAISPLHDKDTNPDTGEFVKPHYHIIFSFEGPTSFSQAKEVMDLVNGPHPQYLKATGGMYRYLVHRDNPEKAQYDIDEIQTYGGFKPPEEICMSKKQEIKLLKKIQIYCNEHKCANYAYLMNILLSEDDELYYVGVHYYGFLNTFLNSLNKLFAGQTGYTGYTKKEEE